MLCSQFFVRSVKGDLCRCLSDDDASKAIIRGEQWDVLDFGGAGDGLAAKITDDLLQEILLCIGANIYQSEKVEARGMRQYFRRWIETTSWVCYFGADRYESRGEE